MRIPLLILLSGALAFFSGCDRSQSYFATGDETSDRQLTELFQLLDQEQSPGENRFILIRQIAQTLTQHGMQDKMNVFLTTYVERNPADLFNGYYLYLAAQNFLSQRAYDFAVYYYQRVVDHYSDLIVHDRSIHQSCLQELIHLTRQPEQRLAYYEQLLRRFPADVDKGTTYYYLAKTYEDLGQWPKAMEAYGQFLKFPETTIPGNPDAFRQVSNLVNFYHSTRDWARPSLEELIKEVRSAIDNEDVDTLTNLKARVNFFALSWNQDSSDANDQVVLDLYTFMNASTIHYSAQLDMDSNPREAYLKTWGWTYRITTWYLYFRKINFPADPAVHGQWEWAGVYFGEKM